MTKELLPVARAVLQAVTLTKYDVPPEGLPAFAEEMAPLLAVALRAAATTVAIEYAHLPANSEVFSALRRISQIADELDPND